MVEYVQTKKIQLLFTLLVGISLAYLIGLSAVHYGEITMIGAVGIAVSAIISLGRAQSLNKRAKQGRIGTGSIAQNQTVQAQTKPFFGIRLLIFAIMPTIALSRELDIAGLPIRPEDLLLALLAAIWLLHRLVNRYPWPQTPLTKPIFVLLGVELVSTLLGALWGTTSLTLTNPYSGTFFWLKEVEVFLLFFIVVDTLRSTRDILNVAYVLALSGTSLGIWGMTGHLNGSFPEFFIPDPEGGPTYSLLALALITPISLSTAFFLLSNKHWQRLFWGITLIPMGYSFLFTFSRQAYIGLGGALSFLGSQLRQRALPFILTLVVVIVYLTPENVAERANTILEPMRNGASTQALSTDSLHTTVYGTRLRAWQQRLPEVFMTNPLTGMGLSALPPGFLDNQYLTQIYYSGILGISAFLWLLWRTGRLGWQLYTIADINPHLRAIGLALTMATIGLGVAGFGGVAFVAIRARQMFWLLAAIGAATHLLLQRQRNTELLSHSLKQL